MKGLHKYVPAGLAMLGIYLAFISIISFLLGIVL